MECCKEEITCLGCFCSCDSEFDTGIASTSTGTAKIRAKFNGVVLEREVSVTAGESIIIPNIFNENYTHLIEIQGAWYSIKVNPCVKV